jgi:hypothetical protein
MDALQRSLASVNVELDANLVSAHDGHLVVGVRTVPESPEHREWIRSAVHLAVDADLPGLASCTVLVPPPESPPPPVETAHEEEGYLALRLFATTAYKQVVNAYPWRDRAGMYARMPGLVDDVVRAVRDGDAHHPLLCGNVDAVLPPCNDRPLYDEVCLFARRAPLTFLEWYQLVWMHRDATPRLREAAARLFV